MPAADISLTKALKAVRKKKFWAKGQKFIKQISGEAASEKSFFGRKAEFELWFQVKAADQQTQKTFKSKKK
jgi:hypothetical protein